MAIAIVINTLTDKAVYRWCETFISDVRLPAMSLVLIGSAPAERAGQGEVGRFQH